MPAPELEIKVTINFYSFFKDLTGCVTCHQSVQPGTALSELLSILIARFPKLEPMRNSMLIAVGVVRGTENEAPIIAIEYEAFQKMAERQFNLLFDELEKRWPVESVRLYHRIGHVPVNQPSLWVEIVAPHRGEAFAACQWLIDQMKQVVPIWKKPIAG